jgi:nucleoside-diphosphate-sugar epimerase
MTGAYNGINKMAILTNFNQHHAWVTGASNQIGYFLLPRLQTMGLSVTALSRQAHANHANIVWQQTNLLTAALPIIQPSLLFHLAPLPLLPPLLARLPEHAPLNRIIALSSTSCFTKATSPDPKERAIAAQLTEAEMTLTHACRERDIPLTVLRPTLIYGCGLDKNITFIAQFIRRFGFFPLLGEGMGLRQPVHADDLAAACIQIAFSQKTVNKAYNLSGGETLKYRDMVKAIFQHLGQKPRIISIPLPLFKMMTFFLRWLPTYAHLSSAMIARMNQHLCFDHTSAYDDFGYEPRMFHNNDLGLK